MRPPITCFEMREVAPWPLAISAAVRPSGAIPPPPPLPGCHRMAGGRGERGDPSYPPPKEGGSGGFRVIRPYGERLSAPGRPGRRPNGANRLRDEQTGPAERRCPRDKFGWQSTKGANETSRGVRDAATRDGAANTAPPRQKTSRAVVFRRNG